MHVLITGIAGFIGFHVAQKLLNGGHEIVGVDNLNNYYDPKLKIDRLAQLGIRITDRDKSFYNSNLTFINCSVEELNTWTELSTYKFDLVIHLAAQAGVRYSIENPAAYIQSNVVGFGHVLDYCVQNKIEKLIYASSSSVYGNSSVPPYTEDQNCVDPESLYAVTKRTNELMAITYYKTNGIKSIGLRFFTVYGPWGRPDMAPMLFADAATKRQAIKVYNEGHQRRDFTYIDDIVEGIVHCTSLEVQGSEILNIGRGSSINLMDFIHEIELNFNHTFEKIFMPAQPGDVTETHCSTQKLERLTGYKPKVALSDGIREFSNWYKSYYSL